MSLTTLVIIVLMSWSVDYINGFHDTANAIATVVSTGVMSGRNAIIMATCLNFAGALMGTHVATAIARDLIKANCTIIAPVIIAALASAILWDLGTWYFGIPSSTSHTLMGSMAGAVVAYSGFGALNIQMLRKVSLFIVISPALGFIIGMMLIILILWACKRMAQNKVNVAFRKLQLVSAGAMAFTHGQNDAQKAMGIICLALITYHNSKIGVGQLVVVPLWVKIGCACMMAMGTASGGWRVIRTMGHKIVKLRPIHGFAAETAAAVVLFTTAQLGIPVSTTHSITGAIMGVGATLNASAVRWGVAGNIFIAWILTIPCSFLISAAVFKIINLTFY
jgi:PiT family inorganic phosphate transporter